MTFIYNNDDIKNNQGLSRPWETETTYLTPVFFDQDVLIKYFYNSKYFCEFYSETYGSISLTEDADYNDGFPFGINKDGHIIAWLGDLNELNPKEIKYLESCNISSNGDIKSQFYDAQISAEFTDPIREVEIILLKTKISLLTNDLFGFNLFKTIKPSVSEIIGECSKFKRIIFNSEDDIKRFLSIWNEKLIENINTIQLRNYLIDQNIKVKGRKGEELGSNKILEIFLKEILKKKENIIAPLFYLYDLRIWANHSNMQTKYDKTISFMKLAEDAEYSDVYKNLIDFIHSFFKELLDILNNIKEKR